MDLYLVLALLSGFNFRVESQVVDCPSLLLNDVSVEVVGDSGRFRCLNGGDLFYENGTQVLSRNTRCLPSSRWEAQDGLQCWTAPSPRIVFSDVDKESGIINITCEYEDVIPIGRSNIFYLQDSNVSLTKGVAYRARPTEDGNAISCKAVTPYTIQSAQLGRSGNLEIDYDYPPYQSYTVPCVWVINRVGRCDVSFLSKPSSSVVSLTKNGENVQNSMQNPLVTSSNNQTFTYRKRQRVTSDDNGTYILTLSYPLQSTNIQLAFDVFIGCPVQINRNIVVATSSRKVGSMGIFTCLDGGDLFHPNGTRHITRNTTCLPMSVWSNENLDDSVMECWSAPIVRLEFNTTRLDVNGLPHPTLACVYDDAYPPGTSSTFYIEGGNNTTLPKGELYSIQPSDNEKNVYCQANTPYTLVLMQSGVSSTSTIIVPHPPIDINPTLCIWTMGQPGTCNITYSVVPPLSFVNLTKNGFSIPVNNEADDIGLPLSNPQFFVFHRREVTHDDNGLYLLQLFPTHAISFSILVVSGETTAVTASSTSTGSPDTRSTSSRSPDTRSTSSRSPDTRSTIASTGETRSTSLPPRNPIHYFKPTVCLWRVEEASNCTITIFSQPPLHYINLTKNGSFVENDADDVGLDYANEQNFVFHKMKASPTDDGTYVLHLGHDRLPYIYTIPFEVVVSGNASSEARPAVGNPNASVIIGISLAVIVVIAILLILLIIYCTNRLAGSGSKSTPVDADGGGEQTAL